MKSYFAEYHKSPGGHPLECSVLVFDKKLSIGYREENGEIITLQWRMEEIAVSWDAPNQSSRIRNRKEFGSELRIPGKEASDFITEMQAEHRKPWFRKSNAREWKRNLLLLGGIAAVLFIVYLLIVPWLSEKLALRVSIKTEQQLGEAVYDAMGMPAIEDSADSYTLNQFFTEMDVPTQYPVHITVVKDNVVNAFALPGGRIVVYSKLLEQVDSYPELAALLSHEFSHISNRHSTRSIFRKFGSKVFISLLFGKLSSVTAVLIDHADNLKTLKYSRKLEKEADMDGLQLLLERKIDPRGFTDLFNNMKRSAAGSNLPEFMGSHPDLDNRIEYINESSKNAVVEENPVLQAIFEKINKN